MSPAAPVIPEEPDADADATEPPNAEEPLMTETGVRQRGEAHALLDLAERDIEEATSKKVTSHITIESASGARRVHKQTAASELNVLAPGEKLSNDRLMRISKAKGAVEPAAAADGDVRLKFGIGADFAMAFEDKGEFYAAYGRVERLTVKGRRKKVLRDRIDLDKERPDVDVHARWYSDKDNKGIFKYDVDDSRGYDIEHVLLAVDFVRDEASDTYSLDAATRRSVDEAMTALRASKAKDACASKVMRQKRQTDAAREARANMEGGATFEPDAETSSGRVTRKRKTS